MRLALFLLAAVPLVAAERVPWTSSGVHGSPEPPLPYVVERAFPKVTFSEPLDAAMVPGTRRLAVACLKGKIVTVPYDDAAESADEFADLRAWNDEVRECYSITFHPRFAENRLAFVWVNLDGKGKPNRADGTRIVKFKVTTEDPPRLDFASGAEVFTFTSGGHNGGNLRFGADGMLYLGLGDAEVPDPPDPRATGQDISDLHASVLRIDVDHFENGPGYSIPQDNPFVATPGARGEVWAYGFRNPWRLAFSPEGELWLGDVGWELWESVIRVERGGNYGWSVTEASRQDVRPDRARGPTPIMPPTYAHPHEEAASITGGEFYAGEKLPELRGRYIYGDWQTGTFWSLERTAGEVKVREMCRSSLLPVGFGVGADGEVLALDQVGGGIWRFARNPNAEQPSKFPRRLSETGIFTDLAQQTPAPGVLRYEIKTPRWADGATSERWIGVPGTDAITVAKKEHGVMGGGRWLYPKGTVLAKTYTLGGRKVETQMLHFDGIQWGAYSYRWNTTQTDAALVGARGADDVIAGHAWRIHSRTECFRCHNLWTNFTPGFSPATLDRDDQLARFAALGVLPETKPKPPAFAASDAPAREYLNANCGTCHRHGGGGSVRIQLDLERKLAETRTIGERPLQGDLGLADARLIAPGDPARSVILQRMATGGRGHMPYLGSKLVDERGLTLLRDWIAAMPGELSAESKSHRTVLDRVRAGEMDGMDDLLATGSGALEVALALADGSLLGAVREAAISMGAKLTDPLRRDLFEWHLPETQRRKTLGATFDRAAVAAMKGDAPRGRAQFLAVCAACHRHGEHGRDFGPDLSQIAAKYPRAALLDHIVDPASLIEPVWQLTIVETTDGPPASGLVASRDDTSLALRLADGTLTKIPAVNITKTRTQRVSLMPEGLLASFTAQEAADLLAFLLGK